MGSWCKPSTFWSWSEVWGRRGGEGLRSCELASAVGTRGRHRLLAGVELRVGLEGADGTEDTERRLLTGRKTMHNQG